MSRILEYIIYLVELRKLPLTYSYIPLQPSHTDILSREHVRYTHIKIQRQPVASAIPILCNHKLCIGMAVVHSEALSIVNFRFSRFLFYAPWHGLFRPCFAYIYAIPAKWTTLWLCPECITKQLTKYIISAM